jgi:hypothetical protein
MEINFMGIGNLPVKTAWVQEEWINSSVKTAPTASKITEKPGRNRRHPSTHGLVRGREGLILGRKPVASQAACQEPSVQLISMFDPRPTH